MDALTKFDSVQARDLSRAQVRNYDKTFKPIRKGLTALILDICPKPYEIRLLYEYDWRYLNFSMIPPLSMSLGPENITTRRNKWKDALRYYSMRGDLLKLFLRRATGNRKVQANEATLPPSGLVTTYSSFRRWEVGGKPAPTVPESTRNDTCKLPTRADCERCRTTHQIGLREQLVLTFHSSPGRTGTARRRRRRGRHRPPLPPPVRHDRRLQRPSQPDTTTTTRRTRVLTRWRVFEAPREGRGSWIRGGEGRGVASGGRNGRGEELAREARRVRWRRLRQRVGCLPSPQSAPPAFSLSDPAALAAGWRARPSPGESEEFSLVCCRCVGFDRPTLANSSCGSAPCPRLTRRFLVEATGSKFYEIRSYIKYIRSSFLYDMSPI
jgi:hypothetical protein